MEDLKSYRVEMSVSGREVYFVNATDEVDAMRIALNGEGYLENSEVLSMQVESVKEVDDG